MTHHGDDTRNWGQWSEVAAALCLGGAIAAVFAQTGGPEPHPSAVVGELTFSGGGKHGDFRFVWTLIAGAFAGYGLVALCGRRAEEVRGTFREMLIYALLPAIWWAGSQVLGKPFAAPPHFSDVSLVYLSAALILTVLAMTVVRARHLVRAEIFRKALAIAVGAPFLAAFSVVALCTAAARVFGLPDSFSGSFVLAMAGIASALALVAAALAIAGRLGEAEKSLTRLFLMSQSGLPLAFFALILPPAAQELPMDRVAPLSGPFLAVLTLVAAYGYLSLLLRWRDIGSATGGNLPTASIAAIVVLMLFGNGVPTPYGMDNPLDYYHHGEWLIPWQQWAVFGNVPYLDYSPSHGLVDYLSGMVNHLLLDGTLAGFPQARQLVRGVSALAAAWALHRIGGPWGALLGLLLFPVTGRYPILAALLCGLAFLTAGGLQRRSILWLWSYFIVGTALVLFAPGQGAMMVVALAPVAAFHLWRSARGEPGRLAVSAIGVILLSGTLVLAGPGEMVVAQIRFMLENRPLYGAVHGLDWARSLALDWPVNGAFWELLRGLWLPATLLLLGFAGKRFWQRRAEIGRSIAEERLALFAGAAGLYILLVVPHTIGRIDAGGPSRAGAMTVFVLATLMLPLAARLSPRSRAGALVGLVALLGTLGPAFAHRLSAFDLLHLPGQVRDARPDERVVDGAQIGIPALGKTVVHAALLDRIAPLKAALDGWLNPGESYLDLSNANAHYFYIERSVPIESGAVLTLPAEGMQARSVARLRAAPPPVLLLGTIPSGAGPFTLPLRAPILADWVFETLRSGAYEMVFEAPFLFAVRPDRLTGGSRSDTELQALLIRAFAPPPLEMLPAVWGASARRSESWFATVQPIDDRRYPIGIDQAAIELSLGDETTPDFLLFDIACGTPDVSDWRRKVGNGRVLFGDGGTLEFDISSGLHVVPLKADPATLLAGTVGALELRLSIGGGCPMAKASGFSTASRAPIVGGGP